MALRLSVLLLMISTALWAVDAPAIVNSGSTNTPGFRIVVEHSGKATYTPSRTREPAKTKSKKLPKPLAQRFYKNLDAAKPLSGLKAPMCMKSASFGSTLTIENGNEKSPDLSCSDDGDDKLKALAADANEIVKLFATK